MAYFETDMQALAWYSRALTHPVPRIRLSALNLLSRVECERREEWLTSAQVDPCADVAAAAVLIEAVSIRSAASPTDLFESDFAAGLECSDLEWEWEYDIVVAHDVCVQGLSHKVWTAEEDDRLAREIALQRAYVGKDEQRSSATALIVDKRIVNQYTRSPRSRAEAIRWHQRGRPRYSER